MVRSIPSRLAGVLARALAAATLVGCATAPGSTPPAAAQPTVIAGASGETIENHAGAGATGTIIVPPARAYPAVRRAYESLGLPLNVDDQAHLTLGTQNLSLRRQLAGQPLSVYLSCGSGITGPYANTHHITLTMVSTLSPDDRGGSTVETRISAVAIDPERSAERLNCGSTGRLEARLLDAARGAAGT